MFLELASQRITFIVLPSIFCLLFYYFSLNLFIVTTTEFCVLSILFYIMKFHTNMQEAIGNNKTNNQAFSTLIFWHIFLLFFLNFLYKFVSFSPQLDTTLNLLMIPIYVFILLLQMNASTKYTLFCIF